MANAFHALAPQSGASSSSSKKPCYDVFINHRGKDVKHKLASAIYSVLDLMGVQAFLDQEELEGGDSFPRAIEEAMRSASVHIAIFSPSYAESPWCLEELSLMLQINVTIIPVFYDVDPTDLRYVAKGKYADSFVQHRKKLRYNLEKIEEWEKALRCVSYQNGYIVDADKCDEGKLLREIVDSALNKMKKGPLEVATFPVGLDEAVQDFEREVVSSIGNENVHIVGIVGMGGSGKTTLAKELCNRKCSSISRFSFLSNVKDAASKNTLPKLQKNLLKDLRIQHSEFHNIHQGKGFLARGLRSMTVLIVLDDVDGVDQLDALLPPKDNLGPGSFIIVTTRQLDILTTWGISSIYSMKLLDTFNAKQLFCRHAFLHPYSQPGFELPDENYHNFEDLIKRFVEACKGLPLSLKVFGAMVNRRPKSYWESQLRKISRILPEKIGECLKISYEALDPEVQQMFLDVACFFVGKEKSLVIEIWDGSQWSGEVGLETLLNKCLVALNNADCIEMHDHLRDLGRRIAEDFSPSRIWKEEQIKQINSEGGRTQIRGIVFDGITDYWSTLEHFMEKIRPSLHALQLLALRGNDFREEFAALSRDVVWLRVHGFDGTNLPPWISLGKLTVLELHDTKNLEELCQDNAQLPFQLRVLIIRILSGTSFRGLPRSIGCLKHLKTIVLNGSDIGMRNFPKEYCCLESLEFLELSGFRVLSSLPDHFGNLTNLRKLALKQVQLTALPDTFGNLKNLQTLHLWGERLTALPDSFGNLKNLQTLDLREKHLTALPGSLGNLTNLQTLHLWGEQLTALPDSFGNLINLQTLDLREEQLRALPDSFGNLTNLQTLDLRGERLTALPDTFGNLKNMKTLDLGEQGLTALPGSLGNLTNLQTLHLWGERLMALPDHFGKLTNLGRLALKQVQLRALPDTFGNLKNLQTLHLWGERLTALPDSIGNLKNLQTLDLQEKQLAALPGSLANLTNLQTLHLQGEQLRALPDSLGNLKNLQTLDLMEEQLRALPDSIGNLTNLQTLNLRGERLTALPDSFGNLKNLQTLDLRVERLTALPGVLGNLTNLRTLHLWGERLIALPDFFGNLKNLQTLDLRGDRLTALPDSFGNLKNLQTLDLRGERLTSLPGSLGNLTNLQSLHLWGDRLIALPDFFGNFKNLQNLDLREEQLTTLPGSFGNLTNLRSLDLWGEQLTALPDSFSQLKLLQSLRISNCKSFFISDMLLLVTELQNLSISNCPELVELPHLTCQVCLKQLDLRHTGLRELPNNIGHQLTDLETLVIGSDNLTSLPESLGELSCLTSVEIDNCQMLESLPQTFGRLSKLQSLKIISTPVVELLLEVGWGCNLKSLIFLHLSNTLVCRISISDDCCPSLKTLYLVENDDLTEIETLPGNVTDIAVHRCPKMKNMSGIGGLLKLERLEVDGCPDLEVLPCPTYMHSLGRKITIRGCPKAERLFQDLGIESG